VQGVSAIICISELIIARSLLFYCVCFINYIYIYIYIYIYVYTYPIIKLYVHNTRNMIP